MVVELGVQNDVKAAAANVSPNGMVRVSLTFPPSGSEENRNTVTSPTGSFAGFPLESCSCTRTASYCLLSAGRVEGMA